MLREISQSTQFLHCYKHPTAMTNSKTRLLKSKKNLGRFSFTNISVSLRHISGSTSLMRHDAGVSDARETFVLFLCRFVAFSPLRAYSLVAALLALLVVTVTTRDIARSRSTGDTKNTFLDMPGAGQ